MAHHASGGSSGADRCWSWYKNAFSFLPFKKIKKKTKELAFLGLKMQVSQGDTKLRLGFLMPGRSWQQQGAHRWSRQHPACPTALCAQSCSSEAGDTLGWLLPTASSHLLVPDELLLLWTSAQADQPPAPLPLRAATESPEVQEEEGEEISTAPRWQFTVSTAGTPRFEGQLLVTCGYSSQRLSNTSLLLSPQQVWHLAVLHPG